MKYENLMDGIIIECYKLKQKQKGGVKYVVSKMESCKGVVKYGTGIQ